jgi:hypothetical protein
MRCEAELQGWVYFSHEWEVTTSAPNGRARFLAAMGGHDFSPRCQGHNFGLKREGTTLVVPLRTVNRGTLKAPAVLAAADVSPFFGIRGDQCFRWEGTTLVVPLRTNKQGALAPAVPAVSSAAAQLSPRWEGTTLVVPLRTNKQRGFSPCGTCRYRCLTRGGVNLSHSASLSNSCACSN